MNNPQHDPGNFSSRCISQAEYDACYEYDQCAPEPEPEPTCEELFGYGENDTPGTATVYLDRDPTSDMYTASGFESGFLNFEEMCGGTCGGNPCDGTCVSGNFWGIKDAGQSEPSAFGLHINTYTLSNPDLPSGCLQTGAVWNPDGVAHGIPGEAIFPPGALGNLVVSAIDSPAPTSQCNAQPFAYCAAPGLLKVDDIEGRGVILSGGEDGGSAGAPVAPITACGNLVLGALTNPAIDGLPSNATLDGTGSTPGSLSCIP